MVRSFISQSIYRSVSLSDDEVFSSHESSSGETLYDDLDEEYFFGKENVQSEKKYR